MNTALVWAVIVGAVLLFIAYGIVSAKFRQRKMLRLRNEVMPVVPLSIRVGVTYKVLLSSGSRFSAVKVAGLTEAKLGQFAEFPLQSWLVLERTDGKRIFVKPASVRYFEEI